MAYRVSPAAESELDELWTYIARQSGSMDIAERFVSSLTDSFYRISLNPYMGRRRDRDLRKGIRSLPKGEDIILYRIDLGDVLILHVVRGDRDLPTLLS